MTTNTQPQSLLLAKNSISLHYYEKHSSFQSWHLTRGRNKWFKTAKLTAVHSKFVNRLPPSFYLKFSYTLTECQWFHKAIQISSVYMISHQCNYIKFSLCSGSPNHITIIKQRQDKGGKQQTHYCRW